MKSITILLISISALTGVASGQVYWTQWGFPLPPGTTTLEGDVNGVTVDLTGDYYDGADDGVGQDEGWVQTFNSGGSSFTSSAFTPSVPSVDSIYFYTGLDSATNNGTYSIDFGTPVTDPIIHINDLNGTAINWGSPFTMLSSNGDLAVAGNQVGGGLSGSGSIQFSGITSTLTFDITNTFAVPNEFFEIAVGYEEGIAVPEPSASLLGLVAAALFGLKRRRR